MTGNLFVDAGKSDGVRIHVALPLHRSPRSGATEQLAQEGLQKVADALALALASGTTNPVFFSFLCEALAGHINQAFMAMIKDGPMGAIPDMAAPLHNGTLPYVSPAELAQLLANLQQGILPDGLSGTYRVEITG